MMSRISLVLTLLLFSLNADAGQRIDPHIQIALEGDNARPVIVGTTNLPKGTKILLTVTRPASQFMAQGKAVVSGVGVFRSPRFSQRGQPLNSGEYTVEVTMPVASVQPREVQAVIGKRGENLSGKLVEDGLVGIVVSYKTSFIVEGAVSKEKDAASRKEANTMLRRWAEQSCQSIYRKSSPEFRSCYEDVTKSIPKD